MTSTSKSSAGLQKMTERSQLCAEILEATLGSECYDTFGLNAGFMT